MNPRGFDPYPLSRRAHSARLCDLPTSIPLAARREERDSNPRQPLGYSCFQDNRLSPLGHPPGPSQGRSVQVQARRPPTSAHYRHCRVQVNNERPVDAHCLRSKVRRPLCRRDCGQAAHVRSNHLGQPHGTVLLLVIFQNADDDPRQRQPGTVQGMHEPRP